MIDNINPADIEKRSFEIISELLGAKELDPQNAPVIKRVIHTTADFDYADNLVFSEDAVAKGLAALRAGCDIVTDTQMAKAGINKTILARLGGTVHCFMSDPDVAAEAKKRGITRAFVSMEKAAAIGKPCIFAIGNAPTALIALYDLIKSGKTAPALVIGVPVGFVNVIESKELILNMNSHAGDPTDDPTDDQTDDSVNERSGAKTDIPYIVAKGRKGGSNVAAAICNALLYQITR